MKKTLTELNKMLEGVQVWIGTSWAHTKSQKVYQIQSFSIDCDTNEIVVIYVNKETQFNIAQPDPTVVFSRSWKAWNEETPEGPRFAKITQVGLWMTENQLKEIKDKGLCT